METHLMSVVLNGNLQEGLSTPQNKSWVMCKALIYFTL